MRTARVKWQPEDGGSCYHVMSRIVDGRMIFKTKERKSLTAEKFRELMRKLEEFCGLQILTYAIMGNHTHILLKVPPREEISEEELLRREGILNGPDSANALRGELERLRTEMNAPELAEKLKQKYLARMYDISEFMRELKGRFAQWYNKRQNRYGVLWADRFKSVLVEGAGNPLITMAAYIDLNAVRAGICKDPKDYRYSGYGEAVGAGSKKARAGICEVLGEEEWKRVASQYRKMLFGSGERPKKGAAIESSKVEEVIRVGGKLTIPELLRCRVRYFTDGAILGSKGYVEEVFQSYREKMKLKRETGARRMRGGDWRGMYVMRDLRVDVIR
jgi:putative transposase